MLKVAMCESSMNPKAQNAGSTAKGFFQILDGTWDHHKCTGEPFNPDDNIDCAKKILNGQGIRAWDASFSCWKHTQ